MIWLEIRLDFDQADEDVAGLLEMARDRCALLPALQQRLGLDSPALVKAMEQIGQILFMAVITDNPEAFSPQKNLHTSADPRIGITETDHNLGYHLIVPEDDLALPWSWMHNGIAFLLESHPICASNLSVSPPADLSLRPWMKRYREALLGEGLQGSCSLRKVLTSLRPGECADPEILFVPGHCERRIRRLIYREADGIRRALDAGNLNRPLARLNILDEAITPGMLTRRAGVYQGFHFAGPVSRPLEISSEVEAAWMTELTDPEMAPFRAGLDSDCVLDDDLEVVGVDPVTALLDSVEDGAIRPRRRAAPRTGTATLARTPWMLEDGPIFPEQFRGRNDLPPLVFSNSYCSLPELGERFLTAGASVFVGPHLPLYSRPARKFAGRFYNFLGDGYCAAAALRTAALACRAQFGEHHPLWLSYGIVGYGSLALQYL